MREILFRGKRIDNGEWVEGNLVIYETGTFICNWIGDAWQYKVDPSTVGQYTGLKDINNKRIFEGDIVKVHDAYEPNHEFTGVVEFDNASFLINQDDCVKHYRWMDYECEVISNIHDVVKP